MVVWGAGRRSRSSGAAEEREDAPTPGSYSPGLRGSSRPRARARKPIRGRSSPGLTGGQPPEVGASQPALGKVGLAGLRKTACWTLPGADNMGACGAAERRVLGPRPPFPRAGRLAPGQAVPARHAGREPSDRRDHRPSPAWGNRGLS